MKQMVPKNFVIRQKNFIEKKKCLTKSELIYFLYKTIPIFFNVKLYGNNTMAKFANMELSNDIYIHFSEFEEMCRFVALMSKVFKECFLGKYEYDEYTQQ